MDKKNQETPEKKADMAHNESEESEDEGLKTVQKAKPYKKIEVKENKDEKKQGRSCCII